MVYLVNIFHCSSDETGVYKYKSKSVLQLYAEIFRDFFDRDEEDDESEFFVINIGDYNLDDKKDLEQYLYMIAKRYNDGDIVDKEWFEQLFETSETAHFDWSWLYRIVSITCGDKVIFPMRLNIM